MSSGVALELCARSSLMPRFCGWLIVGKVNNHSSVTSLTDCPRNSQRKTFRKTSSLAPQPVSDQPHVASPPLIACLSSRLETLQAATLSIDTGRAAHNYHGLGFKTGLLRGCFLRRCVLETRHIRLKIISRCCFICRLFTTPSIQSALNSPYIPLSHLKECAR